ncbi:hypothetical protein [Sodalis sp. RH23]|uniref:hypothetical protein n=1 Tax=unclassified Sodalis (in: enterobacteria) TaxID=2636512 RepID=UPI0039B6639A
MKLDEQHPDLLYFNAKNAIWNDNNVNANIYAANLCPNSDVFYGEQSWPEPQ